MKIELIYASHNPLRVTVNANEGMTIGDVIEHSGILQMCPDVDLKRDKVGIYGRFTKLDSLIQDGDRIEIYRKITRIIDDDDDEDDD